MEKMDESSNENEKFNNLIESQKRKHLLDRQTIDIKNKFKQIYNEIN